MASTPTASTSASQQQTITPKVAAGKGADFHFKENPYTFLESDDQVVKACL